MVLSICFVFHDRFAFSSCKGVRLIPVDMDFIRIGSDLDQLSYESYKHIYYLVFQNRNCSE